MLLVTKHLERGALLAPLYTHEAVTHSGGMEWWPETHLSGKDASARLRIEPVGGSRRVLTL